MNDPKITIPHQSQLGWGVRNLCGQTCVSMLMRVIKPELNTTPLSVGRATGTADNSLGTFAELQAMFRHYGVRSAYSNVSNLEWHKQLLKTNLRAVTLINYAKIKNKALGFQTYIYAHFVVIEDISEDTVLFHDPLSKTGITAEPIQSFKEAVETPSTWRLQKSDGTYSSGQNLPNQAVVVDAVSAQRGAGINIDPRNGSGDPSPAELAGFGRARFVYNMSNGTGSQDIDKAELIYRPRIMGLLDAGITPVIVLTHQTYGEEVKDAEGHNLYTWDRMTPTLWAVFRANYVRTVRNIAGRYAGRGVIWQIMNEQDSEDSRASVVIPPQVYGVLFNEAYTAIKVVDPTCKVITGGYNSGGERGGQQFRAAGIVACDGVAFHPYGAGAGGLFNQYGTIESQVASWRRYTSLPLYPTEFGFTNANGLNEADVARYARAFIDSCLRMGVEAPIWYAYSGNMDNCYGVKDTSNKLRTLLKKELTAPVGGPISRAKPESLKKGRYNLRITNPLITSVNIRTEAAPTAPIFASLRAGAVVEVVDEVVSDYNDYFWQKLVNGWIALTGNFELDRIEEPVPSPTVDLARKLRDTAASLTHTSALLIELATSLEKPNA